MQSLQSFLPIINASMIGKQTFPPPKAVFDYALPAGFQWAKAPEAEHPVKKQKVEVPLIDETAAAIAAAGGGRGMEEIE